MILGRAKIGLSCNTMTNSNVEKKRGAILSFLIQFAHVLIAFSYTPIMLRIVGQGEYGLYQMTCAVISYVGLLELGLSGAYMRFYSQCEKENDIKAISRLNGLFLLIFTIIAMICCAVGKIIVDNIELFFDEGLTTQEYDKASILIYILIAGIAFNMLCMVFRGYIVAYEKFTFLKIAELLRTVFNPVVALPLLIIGYGSVGMCITTALLNAITLAVFMIYCFICLNMSFSFKHITLKYAKKLASFSVFVLINQVNDLINWSLDNVIIARYCGTIEVALYSVAASINIIYRTLLSSIASLFIPQINRVIVIENDDRKAERIFINVGKFSFVLSSLIISGFVFFGKEFINIWAGSGYEKSYYIGIIIMTAASMELIQYTGIEIQKAKNMHQTRSIVYALVSVTNICISIPLVNNYGSIGAAVGTAISLFIGTWAFMNVYYHKKIGLNMILYWKELLRLVPAFLPGVLFGIIIKNYFVLQGLIPLLVAIIIYTAVFVCGIYFIGTTKSDRERILSMIKDRR